MSGLKRRRKFCLNDSLHYVDIIPGIYFRYLVLYIRICRGGAAPFLFSPSIFHMYIYQYKKKATKQFLYFFIQVDSSASSSYDTLTQ